MYFNKISSSSVTVRQVGYNWVGNESPMLAGKHHQFEEPEDPRSLFRKSRKSCDFSSRSNAFQNSEQQDTKIWTHFGPHLLNNTKVGLDFKPQISSEEYRMRKGDHFKPAEKIGDFNIKKEKKTSHCGVLPFCKELLKSVKPDQKTEVRKFRTHSSAMPTIAHTEYLKWSNQRNPTCCSFYGAARPAPKLNSPTSMISQTQHVLNQLQPNEAEKQHFRKLGLSVEQIMGLKCLGLQVSKFLPSADVSYAQDPRIPPSYNVDGATCYWCASPQHVAYGVAFLLKEDSRVVGVALEWNKTSSKVALIQISTVEVVLLIAINTNRLYAPKAINILFRDSEIFKVGVQIENTLRVLWEEFQIESNSYVELEHLFQFSTEKFGRFSRVFKSPMKLHAIASALGYDDWGAQKLIFSSWESRPLSSEQVQYAARRALVSILIFWSLALGRLVSNASLSDLKINVEQFVESVCVRGPISKRYENIPLITHGLGLGFGELSSSNQRFSFTQVGG